MRTSLLLLDIQKFFKRRALALSASVLMTASPIVGAVHSWSNIWWTNKTSIIGLTVVNTLITTGSEFFSRTVLAHASDSVSGLTSRSIDNSTVARPQNNFLVGNGNGKRSIHMQSLINIIMTIVASLLGGPVYFMTQRKHRFVFFILFGVFNSALSQTLVGAFKSGIASMMVRRLSFDLFYCGTVKFFMFEVARPYLVRLQKSLAGVGAVRVIQDGVTTFFRVGVLNWIGL